MKIDEPKLKTCPECGTLAIIVERGSYFRMWVQNDNSKLMRTNVASWSVTCGKCHVGTKKHKTRAAAIKAFNKIAANKAITQ